MFDDDVEDDEEVAPPFFKVLTVVEEGSDLRTTEELLLLLSLSLPPVLLLVFTGDTRTRRTLPSPDTVTNFTGTIFELGICCEDEEEAPADVPVPPFGSLPESLSVSS